LEVEPEVQLDVPAFIPEDYVPDVSQRLVLYKRLASIGSSGELEEISAEFVDRFGPLPPPVDTLLRLMDLRRYLKVLLVTRTRRRGDQFLFEFHPETPVDVARLMDLVRQSEGRCRMVGEYQLSFSPLARDMDGMIGESRELLQGLVSVH
jgi:transcription-repair coupling factor (superfamily II helicase)